MLPLLLQQVTASGLCPHSQSWTRLQVLMRDMQGWAKRLQAPPRVAFVLCQEKAKLTVSWCHQGAGFEMQS